MNKKKIAALIVAVLVAVGAFFGIDANKTTPALEAVAEVVITDTEDAAATPADATATDAQ